jgi:hypothetical protein
LPVAMVVLQRTKAMCARKLVLLPLAKGS